MGRRGTQMNAEKGIGLSALIGVDRRLKMLCSDFFSSLYQPAL